MASEERSTEPEEAGALGATDRQRFTDEAMRQAIELLFFAYRDFTGEADTMLARYGFGRAHHRVIYFVGRRPGMTVSELLTILKITKQSLARVLSQLMREGFVVQRTDANDRRRRRLYLTPEAEALEASLTRCQATRIARAYAAAGPEAAAGFRAVLRGMIGDRIQNDTLPGFAVDGERQT